MSFFGYRSSSSRAPVQETHLSELERLRGRQLASLVRAGGRAKNHQQTTFEVPVTDTPRGLLTLELHLPSEFPVKVPQLKTSIPVHHRWVDTVGNVHGHPDLSKWTAHSDLGRIVTEIVTELRSVVSQMSASKSLVSSSRSSSSASTASTASLSQYRAPSSKQPPQQPVQQQPDASKIQRTQMPVVPVVFSELDDLSVDQLEELNTDRHLLNKFVRDLRLVTEFTKLRDEVLHCNMDIANTTLGYESELRDLQAVVATQRTELHAAQQALAEKQARRQRIMARHRPDALLEQLAAATKAMDNTTDELASQFVQGDMDVARFLATYMPQRNVYHERTLKLAHVTNQQQ
uniref:VPS37 C-terminal domain-containing protein n=1 Tax=Peronospora matthiolae TaxID=2874970 RepID=A0AAV1VDW1_9STRA